MPVASLVAGTVVRGKTKQVLNQRGIIQSINGNQFMVMWAGATHAQTCTKHAFQLWIDGEELQPRGYARRAVDAEAAAPPPAAEDQGDDNSERGSVIGDDERNEENGLNPEDLADDGGVADAALGQNDEHNNPREAANAEIAAALPPPNIVQPNPVVVEHRQGQRVVQSVLWVEQEVAVSLETDKAVWSRPHKFHWSRNRYTAGVDASSNKTALQYYMLFQKSRSSRHGSGVHEPQLAAAPK